MTAETWTVMLSPPPPQTEAAVRPSYFLLWPSAFVSHFSRPRTPMGMRSSVWLAAAISILGCSGIEVDALSLRPTVDLASDPVPSPADMGRPAMSRCTMRRQGDTRTCQSTTVWKLSAQQDCRSRGERLDTLTPFDPCGMGLYRLIAYSCCTNSTMPPPPGPTIGIPAPPPVGGALPPIHETPGHGGLGT